MVNDLYKIIGLVVIAGVVWYFFGYELAGLFAGGGVYAAARQKLKADEKEANEKIAKIEEAKKNEKESLVNITNDELSDKLNKF